jgi:hypothetical protein
MTSFQYCTTLQRNKVILAIGVFTNEIRIYFIIYVYKGIFIAVLKKMFIE